MKYTVDKQDRFTILSPLESNINSIIAPDLKSELVVLSNEGTRSLILDLSNVEYIDSSGLSAILTGNRLFSNSGSFVLTGIEHPTVRKMIEISQLDSVLTIIPTVEESRDYVYMEDVERELSAESEEGQD